MLDSLGIIDSGKLIIYLLLAFAFFVGILLTVSQEGFRNFNRALEKEFGFKKRFLPHIENPRTDLIDGFILKYRFYAGLFISTLAFLLLLIYKF